MTGGMGMRRTVAAVVNVALVTTYYGEMGIVTAPKRVDSEAGQAVQWR